MQYCRVLSTLAVASTLVTCSFGAIQLPAFSQQPSFSQPSLREGTPLKPGDQLRLTVIGFPEISGEQTVMADGGIQVPLAGYVNVWGLTPNEATALITSQLMPYVRRPQVSLAISSLSPTRVSVTGAVNKPGPLVLDTPSASLHGASTLSEALSLAGGVTPQADIGNILIRRSAYASRNVNSIALVSETPFTSEEVRVDFWQSIQEGNLAADIPIYDGDEILVPLSETLTGSEQQTLLSSSVAPDVITVNVGGEVQRPGIVEIAPSSDVSSAVAAAGGLTLDGAAKNIVLLRTSADGTLESRVFNLGENSILLENGDAIIVSQSTRSQVRGFLEIFSQVLWPIGWFVNP